MLSSFYSQKTQPKTLANSSSFSETKTTNGRRNAAPSNGNDKPGFRSNNKYRNARRNVRVQGQQNPRKTYTSKKPRGPQIIQTNKPKVYSDDFTTHPFVKGHLNDQEKQLILTDFPNIEKIIETNRRTKTSSGSPVLVKFHQSVCENFIYEKILEQHIGKTIHDIGGDIVRHYQLGRSNIVASMPNIIESDAARNRNVAINTINIKQEMEKRSLSFQHIKAQQMPNEQFDVLMAVDSLYYISMNDIVDMLKKVSTQSLYYVHRLHKRNEDDTPYEGDFYGSPSYYAYQSRGHTFIQKFGGRYTERQLIHSCLGVNGLATNYNVQLHNEVFHTSHGYVMGRLSIVHPLDTAFKDVNLPMIVFGSSTRPESVAESIDNDPSKPQDASPDIFGNVSAQDLFLEGASMDQISDALGFMTDIMSFNQG